MKTIKRILRLVVVIIIAYLVYETARLYWFEPIYGKPIPYYAIGNFVLFLTFVAIVCYTAEVFSSNTLKNKEINIKTTPKVDLYFRKDKSNIQEGRIVGKFALRNSSNVTAYNVKVENIELGNFIYKFHFEQMDNILEYGGDEKILKIYTEIKSGGVIMHDEDCFWQEVAKNIKPVQFYFTYENVDKEKFYSLFRLYYKHNPIGASPLAIDPTIEYVKSGKGKLGNKKIKRLINRKTIYETKYLRHTKNKLGNKISKLFSKKLNIMLKNIKKLKNFFEN